MQMVRLVVKVDSESVRVPELKDFIGKTVEMIIREAPVVLTDENKSSKMDNFFKAANKVQIDEESILRLREESKL